MWRSQIYFAQCTELLQTAWNLKNNYNFHEATRKCESALKLLQNIQGTEKVSLIFQTCQLLGDIHRKQHHYPEALLCYTYAIVSMEKNPSEKLNTNLLFNSVLVIWKLLETSNQTFNISYLYRFSKVCLEKCLQIEGPSQRITYFLFKNYICIGDLLSALSLVKFVVDEKVSFSLLCPSKINIRKLPELLFQLFSSFSLHLNPKDSRSLPYSGKISSPFSYSNECIIPQNLLTTIVAKAACTDSFLESILCFINGIRQSFCMSKNSSLTCLFHWRVCNVMKGPCNDTYLKQMETATKPSCTSSTITPISILDEPFSFIKPARNSKEISKKKVSDHNVVDDSSKTITDIDQVLLCLDTFLVSCKTESCGFSSSEWVSSCPEKEISLTSSPCFKKIIIELYNTSFENRKKRQDQQNLGFALLELCNVLIENHYYLESPYKFIECLMQIIPHLSQALLNDHSYYIVALLYASLHIDPPPIRIIQFCFGILQDTLKDPLTLWAMTYALIVVSFQTHDVKGLTYSSRLLEQISSTAICRRWVESAQDVVEAELLVLSYNPLTMEETMSPLQWTPKIMYLQKTLNRLFFLVSKYESCLPLLLNLSNVLNNVNMLKAFLQVLSKDVNIVLTHLVPFLCKQRLKCEEAFHSSTCSSLQQMEECTEIQFIPYLLDIIGNALALQAFLGRKILRTSSTSSVNITQLIHLGFDVSHGHPNTFISFLPPLLSALDGLRSSPQPFQTTSTLYGPHCKYLPSIKIIDSTNLTSELLQDSELNQHSESTQSISSHTCSSISIEEPQEGCCSAVRFFKYSTGCNACMKGCYALLQQDNAALKFISTHYKSSDTAKQKLLNPLLSRIRFELLSIMNLVTFPLRLETFQQVEKQAHSFNNTQQLISFVFGYLDKFNPNNEHVMTSLDYIENVLKLLRHILLVDTKLFNCTMDHSLETAVPLAHCIQKYKAAFVTCDILEISQKSLALYQESKSFETSHLLYQGSLTYCPGLGTLSISFHTLNLCLRSFLNVRFICGWIAECQQILSTVKTCFENPFSLRIIKTLGNENIPPFEIAPYLPFFLKTVYLDTLDYTVFRLTRVFPKKSFCLKKCISWNTEMLIVELIGISFVRLYGLAVYPRLVPPFDSCQILNSNDHENIASTIANKSDNTTLRFRITTPLVLLLGVAVYKKLSLWYSGRSKKVHFSKVFRNVLAEGIESCIFTEAPDSCALDKKCETSYFHVTIPQRSFQNISANELWTVKTFGLWAYISDPLYFPSTLEVFDDEEGSKQLGLVDSIVEESDTNSSTTITQSQLFDSLFKAWHHKWPSLQNYGNVNPLLFSALLKPENNCDHDVKQWVTILQSGSILSDSDTDHLLFSWMRRRDSGVASSGYDATAIDPKCLHLQTAMIHFVFDPESTVQWRPFTDFTHYKILMASILQKAYNDFWFGFNSDKLLLHAFFFQALAYRAALYLPKKLSEIGFEASLWGDTFSFFFKETQVAQPSFRTRSVLSYLPTSLLTNGAYSINSLEMNELLDNLANINRAASLGYINLRSFSAAAYTHRQLFILLNDRFSAEECWPAIIPWISRMPVDENSTWREHKNVSFICRNVVPAEVPLREGVQSLFLLRIENSLLGHYMYTQVKDSVKKGLCFKNTKQIVEFPLNSLDEAPVGEFQTILEGNDRLSSNFDHSWYALATCPFVASLQLNDDCCKETQAKHTSENLLKKFQKSCFQQDISEKEKACTCEGCKNVRILQQCLIPVKQLQLINFFDSFVLYARSRVESLLVQFSLCRLTSPVPSGITVSHLKSLKDICYQKISYDTHTSFFVYNFRRKEENSAADDLYLARINRTLLEAEELSLTFSNLTKIAGKPLLSTLLLDNTSKINTPFRYYSLHTLKLLKSCIWIPDLIIARCCFLKNKLYLYQTNAASPFLLKHYVIFLRALVSLNKSLSYLNLPTKDNSIVTTPVSTKTQSWKTQLPSHLQFLSYHDAAPLIRLLNLRSYLLLLGLYSGPSSHSNSMDVTRHLNQAQSTRDSSPIKSKENDSVSCTSSNQCSVQTFSPHGTFVPHDSFQAWTPKEQEQGKDFESPPCMQANHENFKCTETLETNSVVNISRPMYSSSDMKELSFVQYSPVPNPDTKNSMLTNSSLTESGENESYGDFVLSTPNMVAQNNLLSIPNEIELKPSCYVMENNIAWLMCSLCPWEKKLLTPEISDELYELCNIYEKQLSTELEHISLNKLHDELCDKLRMFGAHSTLFVSLQKDCFRGLNILASCFGKYFTNVYQTISRFHILIGNPLEAVRRLEPLLSKSFNRNKHMDTKSSNTSLSKQSNTVLLLYHQMLLYRLRHEEKIKYKTVILLFIILELLLDEKQKTSSHFQFGTTLGEEIIKNENGTLQPVCDVADTCSRTISNLPTGLFHATIISRLPPNFFNSNKQSFTTRQWKLLRKHENSLIEQKIVEILTYLIDLLHFYIRCAKKQATSQETVLLNVSMDSKGLSHVLCQCILIGLYMLAQSISSKISHTSLILPWESVNSADVPSKTHINLEFITLHLVKQLSSIIPLFPKQYCFLMKRYTSFIHRMANTLFVHEVHLANPRALEPDDVTTLNEETYVLALCQLAYGHANLALKISCEKGVYQFVESALTHHVEEHHSLHTIFKTLSTIEKETNASRRLPCSTLDKFRKKIKRS